MNQEIDICVDKVQEVKKRVKEKENHDEYSFRRLASELERVLEQLPLERLTLVPSTEDEGYIVHCQGVLDGLVYYWFCDEMNKCYISLPFHNQKRVEYIEQCIVLYNKYKLDHHQAYRRYSDLEMPIDIQVIQDHIEEVKANDFLFFRSDTPFLLSLYFQSITLIIEHLTLMREQFMVSDTGSELKVEELTVLKWNKKKTDLVILIFALVKGKALTLKTGEKPSMKRVIEIFSIILNIDLKKTFHQVIDDCKNRKSIDKNILSELLNIYIKEMEK